MPLAQKITFSDEEVHRTRTVKVKISTYSSGVRTVVMLRDLVAAVVRIYR